MTGAIDISLRVIVTLSKIMAFLLFGASIFIDIYQETGGENLRANAPWIALMIGVKQVTDYYKTKINNG